MKKNYKFIIVTVVTLLGLRVCLSNEKKKEDNLLPISAQTIAISVRPDLSKIVPVNPNIFGVNIGFAFARELDKDSGFVQLLRIMHPASLRFPGGTVANFYHPDIPVYGYKINEIMPGLGGLYALQSKRKENILYNFIRLCKEVNCGAVFCANMLTGNTEEVLFVIREMKKYNIPILGVELGNEFTLLPYREKVFTSAKVYTEKVKSTAIAIHTKYPDIKIAIVTGDVVAPDAADARSKFMRSWNQDMNKENFYNAYTWHYYASCDVCDKDAYFDNIYAKNLDQMAPYKTNKLYATGANFIGLYGQQRKLWITEWNISNGEYLDNTFVQAAYVSENFLNMIELNTQYNNYFELSNLHAMDGLINIYKGKQKPILSNKGNNATVQYFAFQFLASTLTADTKRGEVSVTANDNTLAKNIICQAFVNEKEHKTYLHFINRSGSKVELNLQATAKTYSLKAIEADVPYATAGKTAYEKNYPNKVQPVRYREETFTTNKITLAPYAFGYVSY